MKSEIVVALIEKAMRENERCHIDSLLTISHLPYPIHEMHMKSIITDYIFMSQGIGVGSISASGALL